MLLIRGIVEHIRAEVHDAHEYAEAAMRVRMDDATLANIYMELGAEEIKHAEKLHKAAVDIITKHTASGKDAPAAMRAIWDYEHKVMIEEMTEAKRMLDASK